jgi:AcrR family transcriptional regulator
MQLGRRGYACMRPASSLLGCLTHLQGVHARSRPLPPRQLYARCVWGGRPTERVSPGNLGAMSLNDADDLPITVRGRATRDRIVSCAAQLILERGSAGFRVEDVRECASVSGSQMTHYFPDKDALVRAVIIRQTEVLLDFHQQPALRNLDTFEDFERWVELTFKYSRRKIRNGDMPTYAGFVGQLSKYDDQTREVLADGYRQWIALLRRGLARMKRNGLLIDTADPAALANVLVSAHQGGAMMTGAYSTIWPDREALEFALNHLRQFTVDAPDQQPRAVKGSRRSEVRA